MTDIAPRMSPEESRAWLGLINVAQLLPHLLDAQLQRDAGITHFEFTVLSNLYVAPDATVRMSALARSTAATLPRLSHVCTRMETRGLVERRSCPDDGRATDVHLTSLGRRQFIRALPKHLELVRSLVLDALDPAGLEALGDACAVIGERLVAHQG
ncbi:MarR family transcriptional regulator [Leucobacter rhizosphaerae]|uniref:MarR family transcriptional regulator n=1 Tax=Leucobacter rhizosphaerae TaxID=2932245 RepID=A0ABY4FT41_9MICO|nr:MarR family transcriptional regulator [Leucobacter rhizosphaerae]UOQ59438.1 MarR family transcriptional regulator [Leucobacter rhizosphaerae]